VVMRRCRFIFTTIADFPEKLPFLAARAHARLPLQRCHTQMICRFVLIGAQCGDRALRSCLTRDAQGYRSLSCAAAHPSLLIQGQHRGNHEVRHTF